jgi:2-dehydropantoate 2-reductase
MKNKESKYRVAIAGIGGVGGYVGGLLAAQYHNSEKVEVIFIARGVHRDKIISNGLTLITGDKEQIVFPDLVIEKAKEIKNVDLLICCVKNYDLLKTIGQFRSCISPFTLILPLENGVDASDKIKSVIPDANIVGGCIYLNSTIAEPGVVRQIGNLHSLYFGSNEADKAELNRIFTLLQDAGIDAAISDNIQQTLWEKFAFISAIATITSYGNATIGEVVANDQSKKLLRQLISEVISLADAKGIALPENISDKIIGKASAMPFEATSSMHSDIKNGRHSEVNSLTEYVVNEGKKLNIATPTYELMFEKLVSMSS